MSNLENDMEELFGLKESPIIKLIKPEVVQEMKLNPPKPSMDFDIEGINFSKIANSSEFKRFIYFIRTGTTFRGSNAKLEVELVKTEEKINIVKELGRGTTSDFKEVVSELKEAIAKRKARLETIPK